jgi:hypothetical protein
MRIWDDIPDPAEFLSGSRILLYKIKGQIFKTAPRALLGAKNKLKIYCCLKIVLYLENVVILLIFHKLILILCIRIRNPEKNIFRIPDPWVQKRAGLRIPDPGSLSATLATAMLIVFYFVAD